MNAQQPSVVAAVTAPSRLSLRWNSPDEWLELIEQGGGIQATLHVMSGNKETDVPFVIPPHVTLEDIRRAWNDQGNRWEKVFRLHGNPVTVAMYVIRLDTKGGIFHLVRRNDGTVKDDCFYEPIGMNVP